MLNTIIHGDCLDVMEGVKSGSVDMILCDLPYGTTRNKWDSIIPLDALWFEYKRIIKDNGAIVLTAQTPFDKLLGASNINWLRYEWIWQKEQGTGFLNAKKMPLKDHENILVFYKQLPIYNPQMGESWAYSWNRKNKSENYGAVQDRVKTENDGSRYPKTVLQFPRERSLVSPEERKNMHPTQKPVALFEYLIKTYTNPGEVVLDNCIGSGTTAVAAIKTGRFFIGIEKEEKYVEIALKRIKEIRKDIVCEN